MSFLPNQLNAKHFPALDLLRGIAALAVCIYHLASCNNGFLPKGNIVGEITNYGYLGVQLFFVISGFIIPYSMHRGGYRLQNFGQFLAKRCVRIEPPYLISLFLVLFWYTIGSFDPYYSGPPVIWDLGRIASHIGYVSPWIGHKWYIDVYWTLAIEFQYYLIVALVFPMLFHSNKWIRILSLLSLALPSLVLSDNRLMPHYGALFVMGMVLAHYFSGMLKLVEMLLMIALCAAITNKSLSWKDMTAGLLAVTLILTVTKSWRLTDFLGKISYSVYLTHILVWMFFSGIYNKPTTSLELRYEVLAISVLGCVLFAYIFYIVIEKPCMDWSKKLTYKKKD